jgi:D-aminopeptidase
MRARDLGIEIGLGCPGPLNAVTDVGGVRVGQATIVRGDGPLVVGEGPVRTGVTVLLPHDGEISEEPLFAGACRLNGNGELTGLEWVRESGLLGSPIAITNSHSVGVVRDALVRREVKARGGGTLFWSLPVVGETWDGYLNDIGGQHVTDEHVVEALAAADGGPVPEGNVGGGTGMVCHDFKGGIGTASRVVLCGPDVATVAGDGERFTVGVLVQANHGERATFQVNGVPVGQILDAAAVRLPELPELGDPGQIAGAEAIGDRTAVPPAGRSGGPGGAGSIIGIVATDAPLLPPQLERIARRAGLGVAQLGAYAGNYSGDLFIAFSTANRGLPAMSYGAPSPVRVPVQMLSLSYIDPLFQAVVEATAEAILNAMLQAQTMVGRDGVTAHALDGERLAEILERYDRLAFGPPSDCGRER